jgi:hypothetical protein
MARPVLAPFQGLPASPRCAGNFNAVHQEGGSFSCRKARRTSHPYTGSRPADELRIHPQAAEVARAVDPEHRALREQQGFIDRRVPGHPQPAAVRVQGCVIDPFADANGHAWYGIYS